VKDSQISLQKCRTKKWVWLLCCLRCWNKLIQDNLINETWKP
jgi:hypothetical protein